MTYASLRGGTTKQSKIMYLKPGSVYIITNSNNSTLYVGFTSDIHSRIKEHKDKRYPNSFSAKYNLNKLIYFESFQMIEDAIGSEKQIKAGSRANKLSLIDSMNPEWKDLYFDIENYL